MSNHKEIKLENGGVALVDQDDYERFDQFRWFKSSNGYAQQQGWKVENGKRIHWRIYLHREINQTPPHLFTDHINGNKLDNRKSNLRTCNKAQNSINREKANRLRKSSELKGVSFHKSTGLWRSRLQDGDWCKTTYHKTEQQAALDYNRMAEERFGEFAKFNRIPTSVEPTVRRQKSSQFRGVSFHKKSQRWRASIDRNGKTQWIGHYLTEIEAAKAYNEAAIEQHDEKAKLNKIE